MPKSYDVISRGDAVRNQRISKGWTASRLAGLVDISRATVSMIEHGKSTSEATARKIAELFGLTVDQLFDVINKNGSGPR